MVFKSLSRDESLYFLSSQLSTCRCVYHLLCDLLRTLWLRVPGRFLLVSVAPRTLLAGDGAGLEQPPAALSETGGLDLQLLLAVDPELEHASAQPVDLPAIGRSFREGQLRLVVLLGQPDVDVRQLGLTHFGLGVIRFGLGLGLRGLFGGRGGRGLGRRRCRFGLGGRRRCRRGLVDLALGQRGVEPARLGPLGLGPGGGGLGGLDVVRRGLHESGGERLAGCRLAGFGVRLTLSSDCGPSLSAGALDLGLVVARPKSFERTGSGATDGESRQQHRERERNALHVVLLWDGCGHSPAQSGRPGSFVGGTECAPNPLKRLCKGRLAISTNKNAHILMVFID